jgi:hypothetical protein
MATPQEIVDGAVCFDCIPAGFRDTAALYLLAEIAGVTDPATIVENAKCFDCIPAGFRQTAIVYLLDQIAGGGGAGGSGVTCGTSDPVAAPSGSCGIHYRTDTGALFIWDGSQWVFKA